LVINHEDKKIILPSAPDLLPVLKGDNLKIKQNNPGNGQQWTKGARLTFNF
jgi:hypothetical protein